LLRSHIGLLLNLAASITPRNENLHPNIPRDAEEPISASLHKVRIVDRRNQPDWISSQCELWSSASVSTDHARDVIYRKVHCGFQASFGEMTSRKGCVGGASVARQYSVWGWVWGLELGQP
jgi:hypothetical protein